MTYLGGTLRSVRFVPGIANPCVYKHSSLQMALAVHVDDIAIIGDVEELRWFREEMSAHYSCNPEILGPGRDEPKSATYIGSELRWTASGIEYESGSK